MCAPEELWDPFATQPHVHPQPDQTARRRQGLTSPAQARLDLESVLRFGRAHWAGCPVCGEGKSPFFVSIRVQVWESGDYLKQTELLCFVWFVERMVSPKSAVLDNGYASCFWSLIEMCDVTVFL